MSKKALNELESAKMLSNAGVQMVQSVVLTESTESILSETAQKLGFPVVMKILSDDILHKTDVDGGKWVSRCCENILYVHAPIRSMRQQVQQGRYILFPNSIEDGVYLDEQHFCHKINPISKEHKDIVAKINIPQNKKDIFLENLSVLGIREDYLFCDNVDMVCKGITESFNRRHYKN